MSYETQTNNEIRKKYLKLKENLGDFNNLFVLVFFKSDFLFIYLFIHVEKERKKSGIGKYK